MANATDSQGGARVRVWDRFVRVFHWTLVAAFTIAYVFSDDDTLTFHTWVGYTVAALVLARVVWGFVGPRHARFTDFVYRPSTVLAYFKKLVRFRAERYLGHSPAGGLMVAALLTSLLLTAFSGVAYYGTREETDRVASYVSRGVLGLEPVVPALYKGKLRDRGDRDLKEIHEFFGDVSLILIFAHIGGVVLASFAHRENLVRAMVTGDKRR
ncbi:MAG: cytochrome b/b6 domain-containing protein [Alphaproteobacteria bacterium]